MTQNRLLIISLSILILFAIKAYYGGEVTIKLNEPSDFSLSTSSYSDLIFSSLLYENFFYIKDNGEIFSNIFKAVLYQKPIKTLQMTLRENLYFSNGDPITLKTIRNSLRIYLDLNISSAKKLRKIIKNISMSENNLLISLFYDTPDIVSLFTAPELIVIGDSSQTLSGPFIPVEWVKSQTIRLIANKFYPGGRPYLDSIRIIFNEKMSTDVYLGLPSLRQGSHHEENSGIYQNIYLCFPQAEVGQNTRIALFSLLKRSDAFNGVQFNELKALTSNEESPITINVKLLSPRRVQPILKYSNIKLYIISSLQNIETNLRDYLKKLNVRIEPIFVNNNQLNNLLRHTPIKFLLLERTFKKKTPLSEKINRVINELSFHQFNEKYLRMLNELEEVKYLKNEELIMEQIARVIEAVINDGFILPLYQKKFSLYAKKSIKNLEMDYYGRPLFYKASLTNE